MRKPFFKRRFVRVLLVLFCLGGVGLWTFYQCLFYVPTLPPVEPLPLPTKGAPSPDPAEPIRKVQAHIEQLNKEAQRGQEKNYEIAVSEVDINRFLERWNFRGRKYTRQVQMRFADGQVTAIAICPMGTLATQWLEEHTPAVLSKTNRDICLTVNLRPVLVSTNELSLEPQDFHVGRIKMPGYVTENAIEQISERVGAGRLNRVAQMPGRIQEVQVENGWFRIRGKTERTGGPRTGVKSGGALIEKMLNQKE